MEKTKKILNRIFIEGLSGMALGLFSTLIIGTIIAQIGTLNAFEEDLTIFRAIEREDCTVKDDAAYVYGQISITDAAVAGA